MILDFILLSMFVVLYASCALILLLSRKETDYRLPKYCLIYWVCSIIINVIGSIFIYLDYSEVINTPIFIKISSLIHYENSVAGIFTVCIVFILSFILFHKITQRMEVIARFSLDSMNSRFFDINNQLQVYEITEEKAESLKKGIMRNVDFYAAVDWTSKFVLKILIFETVIYVSNIIVSSLLKIFHITFDFDNLISTLSCSTIFVIVPQIIVFTTMCINASSNFIFNILSSHITRDAKII